MTTRTVSSAESTNAVASASAELGQRALASGYYHLTVIATAVLAASEIRLRASTTLPSFSILELLVIPALLCIAIESLYRPSLRVHLRVLYHRNRSLIWYCGYAGVAALVGLVRSTDTLQSFHDLVIALALYVMVCLTIDDYARLTNLVVAALVGAIVNIGFAVLQILAGGPYPVPRSLNIEAKLDLAGEVAEQLTVGLFNHPNGLAMFLLPVIIFLVVGAVVAGRRSFRRGVIMAALLALMTIILDLTYAKGAYVWLAVGIGFLILPRRLDRHRVWLGMAIAVSGIVAITWYSLNAFLEGEPALGTIVSRVELWIAVLNILGSDGFVAVFGNGGAALSGQALFTIDYGNAHNAWLDQALGYGVPALIFYLGGYLTAFISLTGELRSGTRLTRSVALASYASLVAVLGESFFEPANRGVIFQVELFLLFAIAAILPRIGKLTDRG